MLVAGLKPDDIARPDFLDGTTPALHAADAASDNQRLAEWMRVPSGPRAVGSKVTQAPAANAPKGIAASPSLHRTMQSRKKAGLGKTDPEKRITAHSSNGQDDMQFKNAEGTWVTIKKPHNRTECVRAGRAIGYADSLICGDTGYIGPDGERSLISRKRARGKRSVRGNHSYLGLPQPR
jgi:hypothetical protein